MIYVVLVPFFFQSKDANKLLFSATIVIPAVFFYQIKRLENKVRPQGWCCVSEVNVFLVTNVKVFDRNCSRICEIPVTEESWSEWLQQTSLLSDEWNKICSLCPEPEASVIGCGLGTAVLLVRLKTIQFWKFAKSKLPFLCQLVLREIHDNSISTSRF